MIREILETEKAFTLVMDDIRLHNSTYLYIINFLLRYRPFLNPCKEIFWRIKINVGRNAPIQGTSAFINRRIQTRRNKQKLFHFLLKTLKALKNLPKFGRIGIQKESKFKISIIRVNDTIIVNRNRDCKTRYVANSINWS
ncbi:hypothetical protein HZS_1101 [Henneguya salminicola]|nr:hypothetical protein HZS_1101 [Henneguya salminicola]